MGPPRFQLCVSNNSKPIARHQQASEPASDSAYDNPGDDKFKHRKSPAITLVQSVGVHVVMSLFRFPIETALRFSAVDNDGNDGQVGVSWST